MARHEVFPEWLMDCARKQDVIRFILGLPLIEIQRKFLYIDWCRANDCELLAEDVKQVYPGG